MASIDIEKQAQDYYGKVPVVILGSGASAAHGLSGMAALAKHLISTIGISELSPEDQQGWKEFCSALAFGVDLESALHQVAVSEKITEKVVSATWQLISQDDARLFSEYLQEKHNFPLGKLLSHMFRSSVSMVNVVTTNYDRLAEYACDQEKIHHYTGFTHGYFRQLANPNDISTKRKVNIWKVHGSLDWFKSPLGDSVSLANASSIPDRFQPEIITPGFQKYQRTHLEPYRTIISSADQAITGAGSYLCVGYGFNDEHIQPKLMVKCVRQSTPITIITYALSDAARKHIVNGGAQNYLAIERGSSDDESIIYSSLAKDPFVVRKNLWSFQGYLTLIM